MMKHHRISDQLVKLLTYILARRPDEFGLVLDAEGFVSVEKLLKAAGEENGWRFIRESHIHEVLMTGPDDFETDGNRIRSVDRRQLPGRTLAADPPKLLYTCIRRKAYAHALEKGIMPAADPWVVLSSDVEMALRIGRRSDSKPVLLTILCRKSMEHGAAFHNAGGCIFIASHIPAGCFTGPAPPPEKETDRTTAAPKLLQPATPGSFILDIEKGQRPVPKGKGRKKEIPWKKERKHRRSERESLG